ncbi:MAG: FadR/GntR family transcriptional regulator [Acidimicrobiia bacterium]|nr:MAG: FadR/GntR family transcriptional regulator [Acidimicrobiia bacterium]
MSDRQPVERVLKQVTRQPLHRQVQEAIKSYIVNNSLAAGDQLPPEGQLAELLGISRNSVREGVKALEVQGIIEARVGAGLFVRSFSFDPILDNLPYSLLVDLESVGDLLDLREVLDLGAVDHLIQHVTPGQLAALDSIVEKWRIAAGEGSYPAELDRDFHQQMYAELGNPLLGKLAGLFWDAFQQVNDRADLPDNSDPAETLRLHEEILDAMRAQDAAGLREAIGHHYPGIWSKLE